MTDPHNPRRSQALTPYNTGERLEPHPWVSIRTATDGNGREADDYGRVDFDDDEAHTIVTVHVEHTPKGYVLHVGNLAGPISIEVTDP